MNVEESSAQLFHKLEALSTDLNSSGSKIISKLCQRLKNLFPDFVPPSDLDLVNTERLLPKEGKRRKRTSVSKTTSIASSTRSKRRKLSEFSASEALESQQSIELSKAEPLHVSRERTLTPSTPKMNSTYVKRSHNRSQSVSEAKPMQSDTPENATLVAESQNSIREATPHTHNGLQDSGVIRLKLEPPDPLISKDKNSTSLSRVVCRSSSARYKKSSGVCIVEESHADSNAAQPNKPTSVLTDVPTSNANVEKDPRVYFSLMTEESDDSFHSMGENVSMPPAQQARASPVVGALTTVTSVSLADSTNAVFVKSYQAASTPVASVSVESHSGGSRDAPCSSEVYKPWLSRLGWIKGPSVTTTDTNATNTTTISAKTSNPTHIFGVSHSGKMAMTVVTGKLKGAKTANAPSTAVASVKRDKPKPPSAVSSAPRLIATSRLNNVPSATKGNCSANHRPSSRIGGAATDLGLKSRRTGMGPSQVQSTPKLLPRDMAEVDRRERVIADLAAKDERHRELMEKRALEHKAKMKALNEHRMAVRANAEREAKEKRVAMVKRVVAEGLRLQKMIAIKEKVPPSRTVTTIGHQHTGNPTKSQPLTSASANTTAKAIAPINNANYMKNFDLVKAAPPPPLPPQATTHKPQLPPPPPPSDAKASPASYDLSGLLSDYNSDSDDEQRFKKRPIPSWARTGSTQLVEWVSRVYRGELHWQQVFRPADRVHFDDTELFHGYQFRMRPRGSSAVWTSPSSAGSMPRHTNAAF